MTFIKILPYIRKLWNIIMWLYYKIVWILLHRKIFKIKKTNSLENYSIGITTFLMRYEDFFIPLIKNLLFLYPNQEIIIAINGHYQEDKQLEYLKKINNFLAGYSNIIIIEHVSPQPLSKMWNEIIKKSTNESILLLNDDLNISPYFKGEIDSILFSEFIMLNNSFSHFIINKSLIKNIGWFDENFKEIGGEDDDYLIRLKIFNIEPQIVKIRGVRNGKNKPSINSYGKKSKKQNSGYSNINTSYLMKKWEMSETYKEGFVLVRRKYWKLRQNKANK